MKLHRNAKSTPTTRVIMVQRVLHEGWSYADAADGFAVSVRRVAKWVRRFREGGLAALEDGSSRRVSRSGRLSGLVNVGRHNVRNDESAGQMTLGLRVRRVTIPSGDIAFVDEGVVNERRPISVSGDAHRRLLQAFLRAASSGDVAEVAALLSDDVVLIADAGPDGGTYGRVRSLPGPIVGLTKVAAFVAAVTPQGAAGLVVKECELNGQPAVLVLRDGRPYTAILLSVADDKIRGVFFHADPARLGHVGANHGGTA